MHANTVINRLSGPDHSKARKLYRALTAHYEDATCTTCTSYHKYGCTIVRGDLLEHLQDVALCDVDASDIAKLKMLEVLAIQEISLNHHRITFFALQEEW